MQKFAYVGCRTSEWRGARGKGIEVFRIDENGEWHHIQRVSSIQDNPSWLLLDDTRQRLYAVHGDGDKVAVFARNTENGTLTLLAEQTTGPRHQHPDLDPLRRNNPVHTALSPDGRCLLIANHEGGNVAALPFTASGELLAPASFAFVAGHPTQAGESDSLSRPHEIIFAPNSHYYALPVQGRQAGNGVDQVQIYAWDNGQSVLKDQQLLPAGSWPRHVDFHPSARWLYGISELSSTVTVFDFDTRSGAITLKQTVSSLPAGYATRSDASEIEVHPNGRFLYAANRGHDSIAVFHINPTDGTITAAGWVACGGKTPRFTTLSPDGKLFYSANEDSDTIQVFAVDNDNGMLINTGQQIHSASPTCICFSR